MCIFALMKLLALHWLLLVCDFAKQLDNPFNIEPGPHIGFHPNLIPDQVLSNQMPVSIGRYLMKVTHPFTPGRTNGFSHYTLIIFDLCGNTGWCSKCTLHLLPP
jgi:hypothetical protein